MKYKHKGQLMTVNAISKDVGIPSTTLYRELKTKSLTKIKNEHRKKRVKYEYFGQMLSLTDIASMEVTSVNKARDRIVNGKYKPLFRSVPGLYDGCTKAQIKALESGNNKALLELD